MKHYFVYLFLMIGLLTGCSSSKTSKNKIQYTFGLEKTKCFGKCPVYQLNIDSNGKATLKGEKFMDLIGDYQRQLSQEEFSKLTTAFNAVNFFEFKDEYKGRRSDAPTTFISFSKGEQSKKIKASSPLPSDLKTLIKLLDNLVQEKNAWKK